MSAGASFTGMARPLVLASGSATRADMLRRAGLTFDQQPARVDEDMIKDAMLAEQAPPRDVADALADVKARSVACQRPDALTIGADQVLVKDGRLFSRPETRDQAADTLHALSGGPHDLISAVVVADGDRVLWRFVDQARLTVRPLSDAFIQHYLDAAGDSVFASVGAYQLEGLGAQLFTGVRGDFFTILGLPLLPLLDFLRRHDMVPL
ncbi:Maf family protein [Yunchengibacter salinarum]|uniref:Maf family protein n=1 Tax=Yunchengibacter salinarum TaxID=3133399 RepID=UPI0035B5902D